MKGAGKGEKRERTGGGDPKPDVRRGTEDSMTPLNNSILMEKSRSSSATLRGLHVTKGVSPASPASFFFPSCMTTLSKGEERGGGGGLWGRRTKIPYFTFHVISNNR